MGRFRKRYVPGSGISSQTAFRYGKPATISPGGQGDLIAWAKPPIEFAQPVNVQTAAPGVPPLSSTAAPTGIDPAVWRMVMAMVERAIIKSQQIYLPNVLPMPRVSTQFQAYGLTTTVAAGEIEIPGATLVIPSSSECIVTGFNIFIGSTTGLTFGTEQLFSLAYNGVKLPSATNLTTFGRPLTSIEQPFDLNITVPQAGTLQAFVNNVDGGSYFVGAYFTGWYHPRVAAVRWRQGLGIR